MCCSGVGKDGALRVVNSGVGINESASIDLAGIKGEEEEEEEEEEVWFLLNDLIFSPVFRYLVVALWYWLGGF